MDNEMIERVAKAIRERDTTDEFAMARAAIEAMREPTEKMLAVDAPDMPAGGDVGDIWRSMIDAVLND